MNYEVNQELTVIYDGKKTIYLLPALQIYQRWEFPQYQYCYGLKVIPEVIARMWVAFS